MSSSEPNGGSRASKRTRVGGVAGGSSKRAKVEGITGGVEQVVSVPVGRDASVAIQPMSPLAVRWRRDGCPGEDFLKQLGLGCLTSINWLELPDPAMASKLGTFLQEYDASTGKSTVDGRVMKLSPKMLSKLLHLPNHGTKVYLKPSVQTPDRLRLFKPGAYCSGYPKGFNNELAVDPSKARVFSLILEMVQLNFNRSLSHTGAGLLEVISKALEGNPMNWSEFVYERLRCKLAGVKECLLNKKPASLPMGVCNWIAHFIEAFSNVEPPESDDDDSSEECDDDDDDDVSFEVSSEDSEDDDDNSEAVIVSASTHVNISEPRVPRVPPDGSLDSAQLLSVVAMLSSRGEFLERSVQTLSQKLQDSETKEAIIVKKLRDAEAKVEQLRGENDGLRIMVENQTRALYEARAELRRWRS